MSKVSISTRIQVATTVSLFLMSRTNQGLLTHLLHTPLFFVQFAWLAPFYLDMNICNILAHRSSYREDPLIL
ncbi:hypothetical protein B0H14DRAFT_3141972, partial [Mycena olivaceomarginata]